MKKPIVWIERISKITPDYPGLIGRDADLVGGFNVATVHGYDWRGQGDGAIQAIYNEVAVGRFRQRYEQHGYVVRSHIIPFGVDPDREAALAVKSLQRIPWATINFELNDECWHGPLENVAPYMQAIRAQVPDAYIGVTLSPARKELLELWRPYIDAVWYAAYWGPQNPNPPFPSPEAMITSLGYAALQNCPELAVGILIAGDDPVPGRAKVLADRCVDLGFDYEVWRRGIVSERLLRELATVLP